MKQLLNLLVLLIVIMVFACSKSSSTGNGGNPPPSPPPPPPIVDSNSLQGTFVNGVHVTSGKAIVYLDSSAKKLKLENFKTDAGPDLYVYLSNNLSAGAFINLGRLKSVNGNQEYSIAGMPDFNNYRYVLIWCQQFGILFGSAQVK